MTPVTKDSGKREEFETGARRDTSEGKPRFDLIPIEILDLIQQSYGGGEMKIETGTMLWTGLLPDEEVRLDLIPDLMLNRLGGLFYRGAIKYSDNNWQKGIPLSRVYESLLRHTFMWAAGDTSEDHLAAIIWNATVLMWIEHMIMRGKLPSTLGDAGAIVQYLDE